MPDYLIDIRHPVAPWSGLIVKARDAYEAALMACERHDLSDGAMEVANASDGTEVWVVETGPNGPGERRIYHVTAEVTVLYNAEQVEPDPGYKTIRRQPGGWSP